MQPLFKAANEGQHPESARRAGARRGQNRQPRAAARTADARIEIGVGDKGAVEARADAQLAEHLILPGVRHVVLAQRVQRRPHVQLLAQRAAVAQRPHRVGCDVLLHVHHHCTQRNSHHGCCDMLVKQQYPITNKRMWQRILPRVSDALDGQMVLRMRMAATCSPSARHTPPL